MSFAAPLPDDDATAEIDCPASVPTDSHSRNDSDLANSHSRPFSVLADSQPSRLGLVPPDSHSQLGETRQQDPEGDEPSHVSSVGRLVAHFETETTEDETPANEVESEDETGTSETGEPSWAEILSAHGIEPERVGGIEFPWRGVLASSPAYMLGWFTHWWRPGGDPAAGTWSGLLFDEPLISTETLFLSISAASIFVGWFLIAADVLRSWSHGRPSPGIIQSLTTE